jgi:hypothetical protein
MKKVMLITACMFIFVSSAFCADVVQIATTRDAGDKWTGWVVQAVTWDPIIYPTVGDHNPVSTKVLQQWAFLVEGGFIKATFTRNILGTYGLRWSRDGELWSEPNTCVVQGPGQPKNVK